MPDFLSSAKRHFDDGDLLHTNTRRPNAIQLWAYGAECLLKAIALKQGKFTIGADGKPTAGFGIHINQSTTQNLISVYNAAQAGTNALVAPSPAFSGWHVSARYEDGSQLPSTHDYAADAGAFRTLMAAAYQQGVLP